MNFSPVSFWIHSNVMVSLFTAFLSFAPSLLIAIPLLLVLPLGLPQFAAVATVFFLFVRFACRLPRFTCYPCCSTRVFDLLMFIAAPTAVILCPFLTLSHAVNERIKVWLAVFGRLGQQLALHK
ncbi:hypothetical protein CK203_070288 [Vitis vinifera]|uniref:Uncharacterized protein n=1 Tax=Vitis vinifera TaxID=29760 RepID=A0A438E6W1_VITVI|nr:hypothetical protein CK203_070288 [Vitis vinifera]